MGPTVTELIARAAARQRRRALALRASVAAAWLLALAAVWPRAVKGPAEDAPLPSVARLGDSALVAANR